MSVLRELTGLPKWVWDTVEALIRYEDEHPPLYRMVDVDKYEPYPCPRNVLDCVPSEVDDMIKVIRAYVREHPPEAPSADLSAVQTSGVDTGADEGAGL